jgi:hypothetical protein
MSLVVERLLPLTPQAALLGEPEPAESLLSTPTSHDYY